VLHISMRKIDRVKKRFVEEGLDAALDKKFGSCVYTKKTDGDFEAHLVALSCGEPPEGFARWSLRLYGGPPEGFTAMVWGTIHVASGGRKAGMSKLSGYVPNMNPGIQPP
jgi:hypothetical protein